MKCYSQAEVFTRREINLLTIAQGLVERLPSHDQTGEWVRCHEVARVVATLLELQVEVVDGFYGMADHSWLWTTELVPFERPPNILDVYCPGRLPQVQLVHSSNYLPFEYRRGPVRDDVRYEVIEYLKGFLGPEQFSLPG
jgi:hypothetical protein